MLDSFHLFFLGLFPCQLKPGCRLVLRAQRSLWNSGSYPGWLCPRGYWTVSENIGVDGSCSVHQSAKGGPAQG